MNIVFLVWACEVIMVCGKRWVVDCGVCVSSLTIDHYYAFLCTHWFSLYMFILLTFMKLSNVIPIWVDPIKPIHTDFLP